MQAEAALLEDATKTCLVHRAKRKHEHDLNKERRNKCFRPTAKVPIKGKCFFARNTRAEPTLVQDLVVVDHPLKAAGSLFVVPDPAEPPSEIFLVAALTGAVVIDPVYLQTCGSIGSRIAYKPAVCVRRQVYVSRDAQASWPELTLLLKNIIEEYDIVQNNWLYVAVQPRAAQLQRKFLAVVSAAEKHDDTEWKACPHAMVMADFLKYCRIVDESSMASGLCGM